MARCSRSSEPSLVRCRVTASRIRPAHGDASRTTDVTVGARAMSPTARARAAIHWCRSNEPLSIVVRLVGTSANSITGAGCFFRDALGKDEGKTQPRTMGERWSPRAVSWSIGLGCAKAEYCKPLPVEAKLGTGCRVNSGGSAGGNPARAGFVKCQPGPPGRGQSEAPGEAEIGRAHV